MDFSNTLFYSLSTMPQVTGAAISLLGVFYIFKIQSLNQKIKGIVESVVLELEANPFLRREVEKAKPKLTSRLRNCIRLNNYDAIKENIYDVAEIIDTDSYQTKVKGRHDLLADNKSDLNTLFKSTFWLTCWLIIIFVVLLNVSVAISQSPTWSIGVITISVILFSVNIFKIAKTITQAITMG